MTVKPQQSYESYENGINVMEGIGTRITSESPSDVDFTSNQC